MAQLSHARMFGLATILALAAASPARAQQKFQFLGPNECINCHDHQDERQWYEKKEIPEVRRLFPDRGDKAGHVNSLKQLDLPKGDDWAKAIGLKDKYDPSGVCVRCHATVFAGDANAGVSCESCHGPASGYLKPHQAKGAYDQAVAQFGMTRLIGNLAGWTQQCTNCHVMDDERLIKAGHPAGDDFDLGVKYQPVSLHFKKKYAPADVSVIAKGEMEGILKRRGRVTPSPVVTPPAPPSPPPAPEPAAPAPSNPNPPSTPPTPAPSAAGGGSTPPAPRPVRPRPAPVPVARPADPPPGSPTSIEPPPPLPGEAPAAAPSGAAVTPSAAPATPAPVAAAPAPAINPTPTVGDRVLDYWWAIAACVLLIVGFAYWLGTRKR